MIRQFNLLIIIILTTILTPLTAQPELNSANIPLPPKTNQTQLTPFFEQGLSQVFIKISGNPQVTSIPVIQSTLKKASNWVTSYHFLTLNKKTILSVSFNQSSIIQLLKANNISIWNTHRPLTLIWLNTPENQPITRNSNPEITKSIYKTAQQRGLPILLPSSNLNQAPISNFPLVNENNNAPNILTLLNNYHAEAVLFGTIKPSQKGTSIFWKFTAPNKTKSWSNNEPTKTQTATQGISQLANFLANQITENNNTGIERNYLLSINNISGTQSLASVLNNLKESSINTYSMKTLTKNTVTFLINSPLPVTPLTQMLSNFKHLQTIPSSVGSTDSTHITFDWVN
jgi:hypothetical protein